MVASQNPLFPSGFPASGFYKGCSIRINVRRTSMKGQKVREDIWLRRISGWYGSTFTARSAVTFGLAFCQSDHPPDRNKATCSAFASTLKPRSAHAGARIRLFMVRSSSINWTCHALYIRPTNPAFGHKVYSLQRNTRYGES